MYDIAFKVDGGKRLGMGHINRCLTVAQELNKKKIRSIFLISNDLTREYIENRNFDVKIINSDKNYLKNIIYLIKNEKIRGLIIDSKKKKLEKEIDKISKETKIFFIDNTIDSNKVKLVVLPGLEEQFKKRPSKSIVGQKYILLNPDFKYYKKNKINNKILISMGSTDKKNITKKLILGLKKLEENFNITIVLGKFYTNERDIQKIIDNDNRFEIRKDPKEFLKMLSSCRLAVIEFGITIYEAAALHTPTVVISHSEENDESAKRIEKYGFFKYVGKYDKIDYNKISKNILEISKNSSSLRNMEKKSSIIDNEGKKRVAKKIFEIIDYKEK